MKKVLITGVTGQYGAYMTKFILSKNYEMHDIKRRSPLFNIDRIDRLYYDPHDAEMSLVFHNGGLTNSKNLIRIIHQVQPHEIYNLSAMSQTGRAITLARKFLHLYTIRFLVYKKFDRVTIGVS
jgi:GDPmannose 4,6-dehydratase